MKRKIKFIFMAVLLVLFFTVNVEAKGGLLGLGLNGIGHVSRDPVGALGTGGAAMVDTTIWMGQGVYSGGAVCTGLVLNGVGHLSKDPVGALGTAGSALVDTTILMGKGVCVGGATCVELVANGAGHLGRDPLGALGTASKTIIKTGWGGISGIWCAAFGK